MDSKDSFAKFRISETELEISGPVDFVKDQVQNSKNIIDFFAEGIKHKIALGLHPPKSLTTATESALTSKSSENHHLDGNVKGQDEYADFEEIKDADNLLMKYSNVLAQNGEKLQILSDIPGNSQVVKMINIVLIYLYWKLKSSGVDKVSYAELRTICEMHGELDAAHFAVYIKKHKKWFLIDGTSRSLSAKITVPGMKEAERLLNLMK